jgi:hypothetical protein
MVAGTLDHSRRSVLPSASPSHPLTLTFTQADSPWLDDPAIGLSIVTQVAGILKNAMNPPCASNVISLLCNSVFKECMRVQASSTGYLWAPSLLCKGVCKTHWDIWTQCLVNLESDPTAKITFDTQMMLMVRHMIDVCGFACVCNLFLTRLNSVWFPFPCTVEYHFAWC